MQSEGKVKYQNANKNFDRERIQSVCQLVLIDPVDEIDIIQELNNIKNWYNLAVPLLKHQILSPKKGSVTLLYNIPTIDWTETIYCSFVLIYWSELFI